MNHQQITQEYVKFWEVRPTSTNYQAAMPVIVAFDTLRDADRKLFPDAEALTEAVAGQVMVECAGRDEDKMQHVQAFAKALVESIPQDWLGDPARFVRRGPGRIGNKIDFMISVCARVARELAKS